MTKKILIFLIPIIFIFFSAQVSFAGEGDVVWEKKEDFTEDTDLAWGVAVDSTGVYVVGGEEAAHIWRVEKRNLNTGDIIWDNASEPDITVNNDKAMKVAVDSTGIYVVGYQDDTLVWRVEKRNLNTGNIIWAKTVDDFSYDIPEAVAIDSTGVYIAGYQRVGNVSWRVEKRNLNTGDIIWEKSEDLTTGSDIAHGVAVDSTGVYVVGRQYINTLWRVEKRNLNTGDIIWEKAEDLTTGDDIPQGVAVDSSGLYVVGSQNTSNKWRVEKRNPSTGDIIWDNASEPDITGGEDIARGVGVNSSCGLYVVGSQNDSNIWRVENRNLNDGSLMWEKTLDEAGSDVPHEADFYGTGLYVVGTQNNGGIWRVERRSYCLCRSHNVYGYTWSKNIGWISTSCENSGAEHWMLVDDVFPDGLETYVWTDSTEPPTSPDYQKDAYQLEDPPPGMTEHITTVVLWVRFRGSIKPGLRLGSQEWLAGGPGVEWNWAIRDEWFHLAVGLTSSPVSPLGELDWNDIKNLQAVIGLRKYSPFDTQGRVTQVYVEVNYLGGSLILRPNGEGDYTDIENPPQSPPPPNYGVDIDETTGLLSGYAWSEHIGWVQFNPEGLYPTTPNRSACLNLPASISTTEPCNSEPELTVSGWARACAVFPQGSCSGALRPDSERGGWDGWILLGPIIKGGTDYGVYIDTALSPAEFKNWAWGSDVVGWISFNRSNTGAGVDYKVMTDLVINNAPYVEPGSAIIASQEYCAVAPSGYVEFNWMYRDNEGDQQSQYNLQVIDVGSGSVVVDTTVDQVVSGGATGTAGVYVRETPGVNEIGYGGTYNWQVRVRSNTGNTNWSDFESGPGFNTPANPWPVPDFLCDGGSCLGFSTNVNQPVLFDASPTDCGIGGCISYNWDFGDGIGTGTGLNPSYTFTLASSYTVTLTAANAAGSCPAFHAVNVEVALPRPKWREVAPTF